MAVPGNKRRKLEHTPSDEEDESASFASFGESGDEEVAEEMYMNGRAPEAAVDVNDEADEGEGDDGEDEDEDMDDGEEEDEDSAPPQAAKKTMLAKTAPQPSRNTAKDALASGGGTLTSGTFKSNMFKLQVDELLQQIRPRHGKRETAAEEALHAIKKAIEQLAPRPAQAIDAAERQLIKEKVAVPFPNPRPPKDAMYKLEFAKPSNINVVGSHALKIANRASDSLAVDMVVQMPSSLFQEKDFLNDRFFYKRAYYLACLAAGLKKSLAKEFEISYQDMHDNTLNPVLAIKPKISSPDGSSEKPAPKWQINVLLSVGHSAFAAQKLALDRNCIRSAGSADGEAQQTPTPFYNSSLRANMLVTPYLKLLHQTTSRCSAFRDACLLGSSWLRQRGIGSSVSAGGFGNFEWNALLAVLLQGGGPGGKSILSDGYSSYQLLKATLQLLAMRDLSKQPLNIGKQGAKSLGDGTPIVWDGERAHNILFKMAPWSYRMLQSAARTTLSMLGDQQFDAFEAMFIVRSDNDLMRFDNVIEIDRSALAKVLSTQNGHSQQDLIKLYEVLQRGFGDRINLIAVCADSPPGWNIGTARPGSYSKGTVKIGLAVNMDNASRTVDHGPSAENKAEAAAFRKFWGERSELRRFKDGSILESLIWTSEESGVSVLEQIARYLLQRHFGIVSEQSVRFSGDAFAQMVRNGTTNSPFQPLAESYKQLESDLRGIEDLPLTIRQLMPADAQLRSTSIDAPLATRGARQNSPADMTIQFEGSSRWPDDLVAIQRTKIAFLLKFSELMQKHLRDVTTRVGLENQNSDVFNQGYLDIIYESTGAAFRMRIHHEREQGLLERQLKDKSLDPKTKETAAAALAKYKRDFIKTPAHTQAITQLCTRFPILSGAIRLTKKWFASHILANHIPEELIELFVARTYLQPWPWSTPSSVQTAFLRTLFFLSRWDWRAEPLIVDMGSSAEESGLKQADLQAIKTRFEAWRKLDPALSRVVMFAASSVDHEGTTYTDGRPSKVVAGRMTALAKAAIAAVNDQGLGLEAESLFTSLLTDYDFVLHLNPAFTSAGGKRKTKKSTFKNLELDDLADTSLIGFHPIDDFLAELEALFGSAVLLFHGGGERGVIAGLWNPQTAPRGWKVNLAYSTIPVRQGKGGNEEAIVAEINKEGILAEMARLGGDLIGRVEVNR